MRIIYYLFLGIGVVGLIKDSTQLFVTGMSLVDKDERDDFPNTLLYKENVRQIADYLLLAGGALLFLWLL